MKAHTTHSAQWPSLAQFSGNVVLELDFKDRWEDSLWPKFLGSLRVGVGEGTNGRLMIQELQR